MSDEKENLNSGDNPDNIPVKKKKSLIFRIFKWLFFLIGFIIILLIALFIFIQTDTFDRLALNFALDKINSSLAEKDATISAESLTGNLLNGFKLNKGSVYVKGDTLLKFNSIEAGYNIFSLLKKEISVQKLIIKEPQINLTKIKGKDDSLKWNFEHLLQSDEKDEDTTSSEFNWGIIAENFSIENGAIRILENKNSDKPIRDITMEKLDSFEFGNFDVSNLNLNLAARYFPDEKKIDLKNLSFNTNSDFNVNKLSLSANIDQRMPLTRIEKLELITDRSKLSIPNLEMNNLNPLKGIDYEKFNENHTRLELNAENFNFDDLTFFLPDLNFLDSSVALNLKAEGNYGNLNITNLDLKTPNSEYTFQGNVKNLNEPSKLFFNITGKNIEIDPRDTKLILPGLPIPDYSYLGKIYIPHLTYIGEPEKFNTDFDIRTSAGNTTGNAFLDFSQDIARYKGDISVRNLNIGKIVKDKQLESNINGDFIADARGFDYRTMTGKLNYNVHSSKFYGQSISKSSGHLNFNRGNVGLDVSYASNSVKTKLSGKVNISNLNNISYDLKGTASELNIASFTKDESQKSNLNFDFNLKGRGFEPDNLTGNFKINMRQSEFADFQIPAMPIDVDIDQQGNIKKISLQSDFADIDVSGSFNFTSLSNAISANIEKIKSQVNLSLLHDSDFAVIDSASRPYVIDCRNLYADYSIDVKSLKPVYALTGIDSINFEGKFEGTLSDSCGVFNLVSNGEIKHFDYGDSVVILDNAIVIANISNDNSAAGLDKLDADLKFFADDFIAGGFKLDSTKADLSFADNKNKFFVSTNKDSTIKLMTGGFVQDSMLVTFDTLALEYQNILISNNRNLVVKYNKIDTNQYIEFRKFVLRNANQRFNISGKYSLNDTSNIKLVADNLNLATYQKLFTNNPDTTNMVIGNLRRLEVTFRGDTENPDLYLEANSDVLKVGKTRIGRLDALISYKDDELKPDVVFYNINNAGSFKLNGVIPYINPMTGEELDSAARVKRMGNKQADLNAIADNFQLKVLQQLIPYTKNLEAILNGKINLTGTAADPVLTGVMDIKKGRFYVTLNKMTYDFVASLSTSNEKLLIQNTKLSFPGESSRFISMGGYVDFTNFTLNEINLDMTGDVKAFDRDNGPTELGISGDLWVGSGKPRLNLNGKPGRFDLKGNLLLIKGNVDFDPFVQEAYNIYTDDFIYGIIIDSLRSKDEPDGKVILQSTDSVIVLENINLNPFEKILYSTKNTDLRKEAVEKSGMFYYNLHVTTSENVFLKFIVNKKSGQEFFGEVNTDLYIDNYTNYKMEGRGIVTLGNNSYYKFFRKFDATGKVTFNGPITNPLLDITAKYNGYASSSSATGLQNLQDVTIDLEVTGNAMNPLLTITLQRAGRTETGSNATSDAISFLLFGKFKDQLSFSESASFGANVGASVLSDYVSNSLESILPFLINTNLNYIDSKTGNIADNADIRFTAQFGDAIIRFGGQIGKIANSVANTDIIIDYPLNKIFKMKSLSNNLILRAERVNNPFDNSTDVSNTAGTQAGALIYYRIKF